MAHKALRGSRTTYGDIDPINDLEQLRKCENRRRAASVGENLDDNPRLLKGPYDSFGSALVKSGLLCEDALVLLGLLSREARVLHIEPCL